MQAKQIQIAIHLKNLKNKSENILKDIGVYKSWKKISVAWNVEIFQKASVSRMPIFFAVKRDNFLMLSFLYWDSTKLCFLSYVVAKTMMIFQHLE